MKLLARLIINILTLMIVATVLPGFVIDGWWTALVAAVVFGAVNTFLKPVILLFTLPLTVVTLGIFAIFVNVLLLMLSAALVPGFTITGLWTAFLASILISVVSSFLGAMVK